MTICLKQILFHQEQLKSNLKELFSHFGKYVKQYTNIFAEVGELLLNNKLFPFMFKGHLSSFNTRESGYYAIYNLNTEQGLPAGANPYGILIVVGANDFTTLLYFPDGDMDHFYKRVFYQNNFDSSNWVKMTGTTI